MLQDMASGEFFPALLTNGNGKRVGCWRHFPGAAAATGPAWMQKQRGVEALSAKPGSRALVTKHTIQKTKFIADPNRLNVHHKIQTIGL
jgi:hypothetical protein